MELTIDKLKLRRILENIKDYSFQLPDFQRDWVWDDPRVVSLLASVAMRFPIGSVMLLERGSKGSQFNARPFHGMDARNTPPKTLVLDGQQRLTSLFQAIFTNQPVMVQKRPGSKQKEFRWYYVNMKAATEGDLEEAIFSLDGTKQKQGVFGREIDLDLSTQDKELELGCFPMNQVMDSSKWRMAFWDYWKDSAQSGEKMELWNQFESKFIKAFESFDIPYIKLDETSPAEAVCRVFEKVNTGGVVLTVFELLTATFASQKFPLRDNWDKRRERLTDSSSEDSPGPIVCNILGSIDSDYFLQIVTLLASYDQRVKYLNEGGNPDKTPGVSCKRKDILNLQLDSYIEWEGRAEQGLIEAAKFLFGLNVVDAKNIPYRTQLVPLAAVFAWFGNQAKTADAKSKLARWYWSGIFGELYGSALETRFANDLVEIGEWLTNANAPEPQTVKYSSFQMDRLDMMATRNSAAYKGVNALLMNMGAKDLIRDDSFKDMALTGQNIDIHHIFPVAWCDNNSIPRAKCNSIVNKTPLSDFTNRTIGGKAPSIYLAKVEKKRGQTGQEVDRVLEGHLINPNLVRTDNFDAFYEERKTALYNIIQNAIKGIS